MKRVKKSKWSIPVRDQRMLISEFCQTKKKFQNNLGVNMICIPRTQSALNRLVVT